MKQKTWIVLLIFLVTLIYISRQVIVHYGLKYTFESSGLYDRGRWLKDKNLHPKVVFLGSSMTKYSIIPEIITEHTPLNEGDIVNLGADAATPYEMYVTYMKNKELFTHAEHFFYSIEPWVFSIKYYQYKLYEKVLWTQEEWKYYMPHWDYYFSYKTSLYELALSYRYKKTTISNYGYFPKYYSKKRFKAATKESVITFFKDKLHDNKAISEFQINYLNKLKNEIQKNGAKFILLYIPNHYSYINNINLYNKPYTKKFATMMNDALGETIQYGSFCPQDFNLTQEDFFDQYHLSDSGARKYTHYIEKILQQKQLLKKYKISIDYSCER